MQVLALQGALQTAGISGALSFLSERERIGLTRLIITGNSGSLAVASESIITLISGVPLHSSAKAEQRRLANYEYDIAPEQVSCLEWLQVGGGAPVLLAGTCSGRLHFVTLTGKCLLCQHLSKQPVHDCKILSGQEACIGFVSGHDIFHLPAHELAAAIQLYEQDQHAEQLEGRLQLQRWSFPKTVGARTHAAFLGPMPASLHDSLIGGCCNSDLQVLTAGSEPPLASFWASRAPTAGVLTAMRQAVSDTAARTRSAAHAAVYGRKDGYRAGLKRWAQQFSSTPPPQEEQTDADLLPSSALQLHRSLQDRKREVTSMVIDPGGRLAAAADSLGRVLLLSVAPLTVLRVWRAYRDAQLAWLWVPAEVAPDPAGSSQPGDRALALVIYAPRRGTVEVWLAEQGPCILRLLNSSRQASLLTPSQPCTAPDLPDGQREQPEASVAQLAEQCWVVDWPALTVLDVGAAVQEFAVAARKRGTEP